MKTSIRIALFEGELIISFLIRNPSHSFSFSVANTLISIKPELLFSISISIMCCPRYLQSSLDNFSTHFANFSLFRASFSNEFLICVSLGCNCETIETSFHYGKIQVFSIVSKYKAWHFIEIDSFGMEKNCYPFVAYPSNNILSRE